MWGLDLTMRDRDAFMESVIPDGFGTLEEVNVLLKRRQAQHEWLKASFAKATLTPSQRKRADALLARAEEHVSAVEFVRDGLASTMGDNADLDNVVDVWDCWFRRREQNRRRSGTMYEYPVGSGMMHPHSAVASIDRAAVVAWVCEILWHRRAR